MSFLSLRKVAEQQILFLKSENSCTVFQEPSNALGFRVVEGFYGTLTRTFHSKLAPTVSSSTHCNPEKKLREQLSVTVGYMNR